MEEAKKAGRRNGRCESGKHISASWRRWPGSHHRWFEDCGEESYLMDIADDATGSHSFTE